MRSHITWGALTILIHNVDGFYGPEQGLILWVQKQQLDVHQAFGVLVTIIF
jgi:hypothetical protein